LLKIKVMKYKITEFLFGVPAKGQSILSNSIGFRTCEPENRPDFNKWAIDYNVSSRVPITFRQLAMTHKIR